MVPEKLQREGENGRLTGSGSGADEANMVQSMGNEHQVWSSFCTHAIAGTIAGQGTCQGNTTEVSQAHSG